MLHQNTRHFLKKEFLCHNSALVETGAAWRNHAVNQIRDPFWEPTKRFDHIREINVPFWCNFVSKVFYFDWLGILIASKSYGRNLVAEGKWLRCQWPILFQMRNSGHISWFFWRTWNKERHFFGWSPSSSWTSIKKTIPDGIVSFDAISGAITNYSMMSKDIHY